MSNVNYLEDNPAATIILAVTVLLSLAGLYAHRAIIDQNLLRPYWLTRRKEYYTLVTSALIHADLGHLVFNSLTFVFFGFALERRIGTPAFCALYVVGMLVSNVGTWFKHRSNPDYGSLGASGAILAVMFASIVYFPTQSIFIIPIPVPIPAPLFALGYLAYTYYASRNAVGRVNHDAHLGGAVAGLLFVALTEPAVFSRALGTVFG